MVCGHHFQQIYVVCGMWKSTEYSCSWSLLRDRVVVPFRDSLLITQAKSGAYFPAFRSCFHPVSIVLVCALSDVFDRHQGM